MFSSKRYQGVNNACKYRYYWRLLFTFFLDFGLGILFSQLEKNFPELHLTLPVQINELFSREIPLLPLKTWWPDALLLALVLTVPAACLFLLGLRAADFFCLSQIWNLIYFALHGIIFHRFLVLFLRIFQALSKSNQFVLLILILFFCLSLSAIWVTFLRINRIAAKGILIPCFGIHRCFYSNMSDQPQSSRLFRNYLRAMLNCVATVYVSEVIMLLSSYGLRKCIDALASNV